MFTSIISCHTPCSKNNHIKLLPGLCLLKILWFDCSVATSLNHKYLVITGQDEKQQHKQCTAVTVWFKQQMGSFPKKKKKQICQLAGEMLEWENNISVLWRQLLQWHSFLSWDGLCLTVSFQLQHREEELFFTPSLFFMRKPTSSASPQ